MPVFLRNIGVTPKATLVFFAVHILFGFLAPSVDFSQEVQKNIFISAHQLLIVLLGCWAAFNSKDVLAACSIGYIVGGEVFWRMVGASIFWEFAKYAIIAICITGIVFGRKKPKKAGPLLAYFLLLVPAIFSDQAENVEEWRKMLSFNMAGPLCLAASGVFFSRLSLAKKDIQQILLWSVGPILATAFIGYKTLRSAQGIIWNMASNVLASGGFGPNQVSSVFGLGALFCLVVVLMGQREKLLKIILIVLALLFFSQSVLTFSRGGVVQTIVAASIFGFVLLKNKKKERNAVVVLAISLAMVFHVYIFPRLNKFTGGMLKERYTRTETIGDIEVLETTGRWDIVLSDMRAFSQNVFGIGVGSSRAYHKKDIGRRFLPHTEWSRMLAEHGLLGLGAILFLVAWMLKRCREKAPDFEKAMKNAFAVCGVIFMMHAGMRLALPSFLIGFLAVGSKQPELDQQQSSQEHRA